MLGNSRSYLESFLQNIHNLPNDLQKQFSQIKDLDIKMKDVYADVTKHQSEYIKNAQSKRKSDCTKQSSDIREQIKIGKSNCDEKFRIMNEIYDTVDNCIRQLDSDFSRFESQLKGGLCDANDEESNIKVKPSKLLSKKKTDKGKSTFGKNKKHSDKLFAKKISDIVKSRNSHKSKAIKRSSQSLLLKKLFKSNVHAGIPASASLVLTLTNNPNEVLDMPMDPYEPIYCDCHDVSYGDMIGCDNPDCPIEWFHFACVGITDKPKGVWYCPRCRVSFSKQI